MPFCIGALVMLCIALPAHKGDELSRAVRAERAAAAGALAPAYSLGCALRGIGIRLRSDSGMMVQLQRLSVGGSCPLADADAATLLGVLAFGCLAGGVLGAVVSLSPLGAGIGSVAPPVVLTLLSVRRRKNEARELEQAMPEAFGSLAVSLGSGHSLPQAMRYVGAHSREPIKSEFMRVSFAISCGVPAHEALDAMLTRLRAPGLELVVLALKVSQRTGAPLKDLLAEAAAMVGDRIELRRRLDVKTSQARMSARMVAAMPIALSAALSLLSSDFRTGLATVAGAASLGIALTLNVVAWMFIRKIMDVSL